MVFQDTVQLSQQATIIISVEQLDSMLLSICSVIDPTSKCGNKGQKSVTQATAEYVSDVLTTF